jgi:pimeloyl-ACP methyl ester carboxylesterase/DNA-binding CsgD family transcriptional regulator
VPDSASTSKTQASLAIETLYAIAAHPDGWDQIIDMLAEPVAEDAATAAGLAELVGAPNPGGGGVGVLVVGPAGAACAWNLAGDAVFHHRLGVIAARGLSFFNPSNHEALIRARAQLRTAPSRQVIVKFVQAADETPQFAYMVAAADLPDDLTPGLIRVAPPEDGAVALIFPAVEATDRLWANLRESFGLTPAETRLAARLRDGLTLKDAAAELGVAVNTVRNQLRAIFDKLGLSRQSDLIRALTQLTALAGVLGESRVSGPIGPSVVATERGAVQTAPPVRLFGLPDGRRLAWREYGDPGGRAVLLAHQGLGCSVLPRGSDALARDLGLRLICPERPGAGRSDPRSDFSVEGVADDMIALCRDLGLPRLQIAAFMAGAPFALAAAAGLGPVVSRVLLASARPSGQTVETERDAANRVVLFRRRILRNAWLSDLLFALMRAQLNPRQIEKFVRTAASAPSDAAYLRAHPAVLEFIVDYISESMAVSSRGVADEVKCAARDPKLDLAGLAAPIILWHGADDPISSMADVSAWIGGREAEARVFPGVGHFLPHKHWPEVMAWLAEG